MTPLSFFELQKCLSELLTCNAFELYADADKIYIPYMMNDALECYLLFSNAQLTGRYLPDFEDKTDFEFIQESPENSSRSGIIFRQGAENVFTLWYTVCQQVLNCYRYDQIGHFWVKGCEHWRRLVYIVGTIYDKYEYMGDRVCSQQEIDLLPLIEFAPFRMYSPIHESLDDVYPDSDRGLQAMAAFAAQAGDRQFLLLLYLYRLLPLNGVKKILHRAMNRPSRIPLYELLFSKTEQASCTYPERDYGSERNQQILSARRQLSSRLLAEGFTGEYPLFQKENRQILAMEEHPFTILESSDFKFRIQLMESETKSSDSRINAGFFKKSGNRSRIFPV